MGTNYYLTEAICQHCGRGSGTLHIGKSSAGWCFALHVMPDDGINELADWQARWDNPDAQITDEYGKVVPPTEMTNYVTCRAWDRKEPLNLQWYEMNHVTPGPNGLARHKIDGRHCSGHGDGTYDLLPGEFS